MRFSSALKVVALALASAAVAQQLQNELSFGHDGKVADGHEVPHFNLLGNPQPQILSNKIILTPPHAGSLRSAIWSRAPLNLHDWTVDVEFRATGPDRHGGGKMAIWLVKEGSHDVGTASIYTVGPFDGFALVLDTYQSIEGTVRGFLNDGLSNYKNHHSVDSLAFGHCFGAFRNLGRPTIVRIEQTPANFRVLFDGSLCFESAKIRIPEGYTLGISAASAEEPDSFEVFKLAVHTPVQSQGSAGTTMDPPPAQKPVLAHNSGEVFSSNIPASPETPADTIEQSKQFADLHDRLQQLARQISAFQRDFQQFQREANHRHDELRPHIISGGGGGGSAATPSADKAALDRAVQDIKNAIAAANPGQQYQRHADEMQRAIRDGHSTLLSSFTGQGAGLGLWGILGCVLLSQVVVGGAYVLWKKRREGGDKKFL